jgi:hypothetical protein
MTHNALTKGYGLVTYGLVGGRGSATWQPRVPLPTEEKSAIIDKFTRRILSPEHSDIREPPPETAALKEEPSSGWTFVRSIGRRISGMLLQM